MQSITPNTGTLFLPVGTAGVDLTKENNGASSSLVSFSLDAVSMLLCSYQTQYYLYESHGSENDSAMLDDVHAPTKHLKGE